MLIRRYQRAKTTIQGRPLLKSRVVSWVSSLSKGGERQSGVRNKKLAKTAHQHMHDAHLYASIFRICTYRGLNNTVHRYSVSRYTVSRTAASWKLLLPIIFPSMELSRLICTIVASKLHPLRLRRFLRGQIPKRFSFYPS